MDVYGWRGAMLITSGLVAHVCCMAPLLVTSHNIQKKTTTNDDTEKKHFSSDSNVTRKSSSGSVCVQLQTIFTNAQFVFLCIVIGLFLFSSSVGFTHLIAFAESEGLNPYWSTVAASMAGVGSFGKYMCTNTWL